MSDHTLALGLSVSALVLASVVASYAYQALERVASVLSPVL